MGSSKLTVTRLKNNSRDNIFLGTSSLLEYSGPITCCKDMSCSYRVTTLHSDTLLNNTTYLIRLLNL
ncbi:hypothetical protein P691DRAFT_803420, partial [Macrolepiota fuliginosa MF-IS2]